MTKQENREKDIYFFLPFWPYGNYENFIEDEQETIYAQIINKKDSLNTCEMLYMLFRKNLEYKVTHSNKCWYRNLINGAILNSFYELKELLGEYPENINIDSFIDREVTHDGF